MRKLLFFACIALFIGCSGDKNDANKTYEAKFTHVSNANTPKGKAADLFAKRAGENHYPKNQTSQSLYRL